MDEDRLSAAEAAELAGAEEAMIRFWIEFAYFPQPPGAVESSVDRRDLTRFLQRRKMNEQLTRAHRQRPDLD